MMAFQMLENDMMVACYSVTYRKAGMAVEKRLINIENWLSSHLWSLPYKRNKVCVCLCVCASLVWGWIIIVEQITICPYKQNAISSVIYNFNVKNSLIEDIKVLSFISFFDIIAWNKISYREKYKFSGHFFSVQNNDEIFITKLSRSKAES